MRSLPFRCGQAYEKFCLPVKIRHTFHVRKVRLTIAVATALAAASFSFNARAQTWQQAVANAAHQTPDMRAVVLDLASGRLVAGQRLTDAAHTLSAPGSTLKPLVLYQLLARGLWNSENRVSCDRKLEVAGHRLACSHPSAPPFDAREALAWSCNSYFAAIARTLKPEELGKILAPTGLLGTTGLARDEATAEFHEPQSIDAEQLALLGVDGIRVTPLELAVAYRWLAHELAAQPDLAAAQTVREGLADSASFGIAGAASLGGVAVLGKTGTAEGAVSSQTHGWFAGLAPAQNPQFVIVVYLPAGRGTDAARVAGEILAHAPVER